MVSAVIVVAGFGLALLVGFAAGGWGRPTQVSAPAPTVAPAVPAATGDPIPVVEPIGFDDASGDRIGSPPATASNTATDTAPSPPSDPAPAATPSDPTAASTPTTEGPPAPPSSPPSQMTVRTRALPPMTGGVTLDDVDHRYSATTPDGVAATDAALQQPGGGVPPSDPPPNAAAPPAGAAGSVPGSAPASPAVDRRAPGVPAPFPVLDLGPTPLTDPVLQFVDACTGGAKAGCPDGTVGTVLAEGYAVPDPPMQFLHESYTADHALTASCAGTRRSFPGQAVVELITNNPGTIVLTGDVSATVDTPPAATQQWRDQPEARVPVTTCVAVSNPPDAISIRATATDVNGSVAAADLNLRIESRTARPPVTLTPTGLTALRIVVPVRPNEVTALLVHPADRSGAANPCRTADATQLDAEAQRRPFDVAALDAQYDRAFSEQSIMTILAPADTSDICVLVVRTESAGTRFVSLARSYRITPPSLYRIDSEITALKTVSGVAPSGPLTVAVKRKPGFAPCTVTVDAPTVRNVSPRPTSTASWGGIPLCAQTPGESDGFVEIDATLAGVRHEVATAVPSRVCVTTPSSNAYCPVVPLDRLIEVPVSADASVHVHLHLDPTPGMQSRWLIGDADDRLGQVGTALEPAPPSATPVLDLVNTTVTPGVGPTGEAQLVVRWVADRPVFVNAWIEDFDHATCSREPVNHDAATGSGHSRLASDQPSDQGVVTFDGLCAGTHHQIALSLQDRSGGQVSSYGSRGAGRRAAGEPLRATTNGVDAEVGMRIHVVDTPAAWSGLYLRVVDTSVGAAGAPASSAYIARDPREPSIHLPANDWQWAHCGAASDFEASITKVGKWSEDIDFRGGIHAYLSATPCGAEVTQTEIDQAPTSHFLWDNGFAGHARVELADTPYTGAVPAGPHVVLRSPSSPQLALDLTLDAHRAHPTP